MRRIYNVILFLLLVGTILIFDYQKKKDISRFNNHLKRAETFEGMNANQDAILEYKQALFYQDNPDITKKLFNLYLKRGDSSQAEERLKKLIVKNLASNKEIHDYLDHLFLKEDFASFNGFINNFKDMYDLEKYEYQRNFTYLTKDHKYSEVKQQGLRWFLVADEQRDFIINDQERILTDKETKTILNFDEINQEYLAITDRKKTIYKINKEVKGQLPDHSHDIYLDSKYLIKNNNGMILADRLGEVLCEADFISQLWQGKYISLEKDQWYIHQKQHRQALDLQAKAIRLNKLEQAVIDDKLIYENNGNFIYDLNTKKQSANYEQVDFSYSENIAVKSKEGWGFINQNFDTVSKMSYEGAKSFSNGIGAVQINGLWYFIDDEFRLDSKAYEDIITPNDIGIAFIKEDGLWSMITFIKDML